MKRTILISVVILSALMSSAVCMAQVRGGGGSSLNMMGVLSVIIGVLILAGIVAVLWLLVAILWKKYKRMK